MKKLIFCVLALTLLTSCCRRVIGTTTTIKDTTTITVKERIIDTIIQADTITNTIQLECDSNNKVVLKSKTNNKSSRAYQNVSLNNGLLSVQSICESLRLQLIAKDSIISHLKETHIKETIIEKKGFWGTLGEIGKHILYITLSLIVGVVLGKLFT